MPDTIDSLCNEFQQFIRGCELGRPENLSISDYIDEWAFEGNCAGVIAVNGDYELFLQVVIAIIARCLSDPHFLDFEDSGRAYTRPVRWLVNPTVEGNRLNFIDKYMFQSIVFKFMTEGRNR